MPIKTVETCESRAGIRVGDAVLVTEVESPWIAEPWRGRVMRMYEGGDVNVTPTEPVNYRIGLKPSEHYVTNGLYLTGRDKLEKVS